MNRIVLLVVMLSSAAWADIPPRDASGCNGKIEGAACKRDDGSEASCAKATCSRNDYSNGPPPTSVSYECLTCSGAPPAAEKKQSCAAMPGEALLGLLVLLARRRLGRVS
jgi:hypothetical protein